MSTHPDPLNPITSWAFMPSKNDEQTRAKAVRLVTEHVQEYTSEWAAIKAVSARLGMTAETLRHWVRQAQIDGGQADGVSSEGRRVRSVS